MPNLHSTKILGDLRVTGLTNLNQLGAVTLTGQLTSTVATGTAPFVIASTTAVTNLNADLLDGNHASAFYLASNPSGYASGTVTSIATAGSVSGLTLTGGTITTSGTITLGGTLSVAGSNFGSQTANTFLAAPNGSAGNPTFRTIVAADIPTLNQNTTGSAGSVVQSITFNNIGSGVASGTTYNGSTARTISYNTIGAEPTLTKGNLTATGPISLSATRQVIGGAVTITHDNSGVTAGSYNNVTVNATGHVTAGSTVAYLTTQNTSKNIVANSNTATADAVATNGNVHINHLENSTVTSAHRISGSGATTVTSDASGNITISSTDTNTTYSEISEAETDSTTDSNGRLITGRRYQYGLRNNVTATTTSNLAVGATVSGATKTVNLGTGAATGSTTDVNIGSGNGGTTIIASPNTTISGNLTINGTTTTINSTVKVLNDPIMSLGGTGAAPTSNDAKDRGIQFVHYDSAARNGFFGYDNSLARFIYVPQATLTDEVISGNTGIARFSNLELGNLTGNIGTLSTATLTGARTYTLPDASGTIALSGHAMTSHSATNWQVFHSNGSGQVVELALGAAGTVLKSNGATSAPSWQTDNNTDTLDTAGAANSTSKLFLVGRTAQTTGVSNSNVNVFTTDGTLFAPTLAGGEASGANLTIRSTSNATKGTITIDSNTEIQNGPGTTYNITSTPTLSLGTVSGSSRGYMRVYGTTAGSYGVVQMTNSNLHIDGPAAGDLYLNNYVNRPTYIGTGGTSATLGVGTTTVPERLTVNGNIRLSAAGKLSTTTGNLTISTEAATTDLILNPTRNVGIGTATPAEKLDILGNARIQGNILLDGTGTTTNQARTISFTGFDKETIGDVSDAAFIRHTINTAGHSGSVLEISSQNDATDGIGFTTNATSRLKHNSSDIFSAQFDAIFSGAKKLSTSTGNLTLATDAGNGNIILSPNGTGVITSTARLGLGTTAPTSVIHVKNATPEIKLEAGSTTDSGTMRYNTTTKSIEFIFA
jgi:hypothetical protein